MKILFFTRSYYPNIGGVEKHLFEITKILINKGFEVIIIAESPRFKYKNKSKTKNLQIIHVPFRKENKFKKFLIWKDLFKHINVIKSADIIHCHDVFYWYLPFRVIFPFKKVFTTFHGYEGNLLPNKKAILMHKMAEYLSFGNICVGDFLSKWYGTKPTFIIYGAINKSLLNVKAKKNKKKFVFVGRLEKETGANTYLKALKILRDRKIKIELDVYGDGAEKNNLIKYTLHNNLRVNFKGSVNNIEKKIVNYEYIFCSRYLSILEGLALRLKIISEYNNEIKKDYLKMSPFSKYILISNDSEEIANKIELLLLDKIYLDINGGYNWVKSRTWESLVNTYLNLWGLR